MKNPEQWLNDHWRDKIHSDDQALELCRAIQRDAYQQALLDVKITIDHMTVVPVA